MNLPYDLQAALLARLETISAKVVSHTASDLSQRYRSGHAQDQRVFLRSKDDVIAYAAYRLPATFAAIYASLVEIRNRRPDWQPHTLLDVGAGPGTAMWAATAVWPELKQVTLLERDTNMITFGKELAPFAQSSAIKQAIWHRTDLTQKWESSPHDLVIGAYMLGELPLATHEHFIKQLWSYATDTLLIVEPGTPRGFALIRTLRQQLLADGATTLAPCPHDRGCPISLNDWCHFAQRLNRSKLHRNTKDAALSYEDEKFSYAAMTHIKRLPIKGRVIRHPQKRSGHIRLELCTPDGLKHIVVTRSERAAFREAQDLRWGNAISDNILDNTLEG